MLETRGALLPAVSAAALLARECAVMRTTGPGGLQPGVAGVAVPRAAQRRLNACSTQVMALCILSRLACGAKAHRHPPRHNMVSVRLAVRHGGV
jgi:hypothetical protein